ncbi:DUF5980 family protein [Amycolatopsis magusensis]|uniref:DUF5980 family protein n=1 Tax=Amycolatopsis magusensis TaxID=882444 RepID=UPI0027E13D83|nr:DUF5980 family protein [Amycolatopsis magusensis]
MHLQEVFMRSSRGVGLVLGSVLALLSVTPASASASTWTLRGDGQRICLKPDTGHPGAYFFAQVDGSWSATITTGIRNLPPGSFSTGASSLPPGSHDGSYVNGFVGVHIAPAPAGKYFPEVWASDGSASQAVRVEIDFAAGC